MRCHLIWAVAVTSIGSGFQHGYNTGVVNPVQQVLTTWMMMVGGTGLGGSGGGGPPGPPPTPPHTTEQSKNPEGEHESGSGSGSHHSPEDYDMPPGMGEEGGGGSSIDWSIVVSIYCVGGTIGGALVGIFAKSMGPKVALMLNNVFVLIAALLFCCSFFFANVWVLIVARFIVGINSGLNAGLAPIYLSEISPTAIRGAIGSTYQLSITVSILLAQILGMDSVLGNFMCWMYLLCLILAPALFQVIGFITVPESPKYSVEYKQNDEKAIKGLKQLVGEEEAGVAMAEIKKEVEKTRSQPKVTLWKLMTHPPLRKPLTVLCVLMLAQQLSGINAVMFYSTHIFTMAKFSHESSQYSTLGVGSVNVAITILSLWLVEKFGRKSLLLFGFAGMFISTTCLFVCLYFVEASVWAGYMSLVCVYLYVIFFGSGVGSIPWLLGPELFDTAARPAAISLAVPVNWLTNFAVGLAFLPLQGLMGPSVFAIFMVCQVLSFFFVWIFAPETKNRPIEEITALFQ